MELVVRRVRVCRHLGRIMAVDSQRRGFSPALAHHGFLVHDRIRGHIRLRGDVHRAADDDLQRTCRQHHLLRGDIPLASHQRPVAAVHHLRVVDARPVAAPGASNTVLHLQLQRVRAGLLEADLHLVRDHHKGLVVEVVEVLDRARTARLQLEAGLRYLSVGAAQRHPVVLARPVVVGRDLPAVQVLVERLDQLPVLVQLVAHVDQVVVVLVRVVVVRDIGVEGLRRVQRGRRAGLVGRPLVRAVEVVRTCVRRLRRGHPVRELDHQVAGQHLRRHRAVAAVLRDQVLREAVAGMVADSLVLVGAAHRDGHLARLRVGLFHQERQGGVRLAPVVVGHHRCQGVAARRKVLHVVMRRHAVSRNAVVGPRIAVRLGAALRGDFRHHAVAAAVLRQLGKRHLEGIRLAKGDRAADLTAVGVGDIVAVRSFRLQL